MTGFVDDHGRALLRVTLRHPTPGASQDVDAWIDTAYTGERSLPLKVIAALGLQQNTIAMIRLAAGPNARVETYFCQIDWFGQRLEVEAFFTRARFPLIGVQLRAGHQLTIDYRARTVMLL
jgi:predicted aspartyl protease